MSKTSRRNIFDLMNERYDLDKEITKLDELLNEYSIWVYETSYSLEEFVDEYVLYHWKNVGSYTNCEEIRNDLGMHDILLSCEKKLGWKCNPNGVMNYIEYIVNLIEMSERYINKHFDNRIIRFEKEYYQIKRNLNILLDRVNYEYKYFNEYERAILVEKNAATTLVAEIVEDGLAYKVVEYNHHLLKGNMIRKREILQSLADKIEGFRDNLEKDLRSDFGFLANNINIRHNNIEGINRKDYIADMNPKDLELWYDQAYQIMLLCIIENDYKVSRKLKVSDLKKEMQEYKDKLIKKES